MNTLTTRHDNCAATYRVAIPSLDKTAIFDVGIEDGVFARIDAVADREADADSTLELWPGFVEAHAHLGLPANFDDSLDDPRISALQYVYHGVTHVIDMFGFPMVKDLWVSGKQQSPVPYPDLVHCGYAATSMRDSDGLTGHGVEFPSPVFMLGIRGDIDAILHANREHGASFMKVMFTEGVEQPGLKKRFSRLSPSVLEHMAQATTEHGIACVLDCNTRDEVLQAYGYGFRLFAHPVRDVELSTQDWIALDSARFISTLSGLRPMIMEREDFLYEYGRPGFEETQDVENLRFVSTVEETFGVQMNCQESRTAALRVMRTNCLAALERRSLILGTDCGNTGAFHGYSLLGELGLLAGDQTEYTTRRRHELLQAATVDGRRLFDDLAGKPETGHPVAVGNTATFNLLRSVDAGGSPSALPEVTVVSGVAINRQAVADGIHSLRSSPTRGKVTL